MPKRELRIQNSEFRKKVYSSLHSKFHTLNSPPGFTLVEILVTISIIALVGGIIIPNFRSFTEEQQLKTSTSEILQAIRQVQTNAQSSVRCPTSATDPFSAVNPSKEWRIAFNDTQSYKIYCIEVADPLNPKLIKTVNYAPVGVIQYDSATCNDGLPPTDQIVTFNQNNVSFSCPPSSNELTIKIKHLPLAKTSTVTINKGGSITSSQI